MTSKKSTWWFPEIGLASNHPFIDGCPIINQPFWDISIYGNPHVGCMVPFKGVVLRTSWRLGAGASMHEVSIFLGPKPLSSEKNILGQLLK